MDLFGLGRVSPHPEGLELLITTYDLGQLSVVRSLLDSEKIPYMIKERGAGGTVKVIAGYSTFGTDFFVRREDLETAKALLTPADDTPEEAGDSTPSDDKPEN